MRISPPSASSSVMSRRRIVVLPEPDGPMSVTRSPLATLKLSPSSTTLSPKRLMTSRNSMAGVVSGVVDTLSSGDVAGLVAGSITSGKALLHPSHEERGRVAGRQEEQADHGERLD